MHRWLIFFLVWVINPLLLCSQPLNQHRIKQLAAFGKVWGLLKYYHPLVAKGTIDWDQALTSRYYTIKKISNKTSFNREISKLLDSIGPVKPYASKIKNCPDSLKKNLNLSWMEDTGIFSSEVIKRLKFIVENHPPVENYYIQRRKHVGNPVFPNENPYNEIYLPNEPYRILALFRYWNIINYYYPYLFQTDKNWNLVLEEFIPRFINITSDYEYYRKIQELSAQLNDGHGMVYSLKYNYFSNIRAMPIKVANFAGNTYITGCLDDSVCKASGIRAGDIVLKIDEFDAEMIRNHIARYTPSSNNTYREYKENFWFPLVKKDTVALELNRNGKVFQTRIPASRNQKYLIYSDKKRFEGVTWRRFSDSIGFINMGLLKEKDINPMYRELKSTKYLILDSRNYPNWILYPLAKKLLKHRKIFMKITEPDYDFPGLVKWIPPLKAGKLVNPNYYRGKIIILVNSETMSRAEFTTMAIKQAENVIIIGSQTAGADGDVSIIPLPGGIYAYYSGIGVYYPNCGITQRVGIVPDIVVKPTLEGTLNNVDEYFDRALEYIRTGK